MLKKLGIVKTKNKGYKVFMEHIAPDFLDNTMIPSEYVKFCWKKYETSHCGCLQLRNTATQNENIYRRF